MSSWCLVSGIWRWWMTGVSQAIVSTPGEPEGSNAARPLCQLPALLARHRTERTVAKMVDFSRTTTINHSRGLCRAAAPTVQGGSARESHPGTPS